VNLKKEFETEGLFLGLFKDPVKWVRVPDLDNVYEARYCGIFLGQFMVTHDGVGWDIVEPI